MSDRAREGLIEPLEPPPGHKTVDKAPKNQASIKQQQ